MDQQKLLRVRSLPLSTLGLPVRTLRPLLERLGGTSLAAAEQLSVGDLMDAAEAHRVFTAFETSGDSTMLQCFKSRLVEVEGLTYFEWRYLPPETVTPLLASCPPAQILACDARVLNTFSNAVLFHMANEFHKTVHPGKVVLPDEITVAELLKSHQFLVISRQTVTFARYLAETRDKLRALGFTGRNGILLRK